MKIALSIICSVLSGALMAVPIGFGVEAKLSPLLGIPIAILFMGVMVVVLVFFVPSP